MDRQAESTQQHPRRIDWRLYDDESGLLQPHEPLEAYGPGGFHPVALGDLFDGGRYRIHDKLGYGGHSTVWLTKDTHERRWVSLKIKKANSSADDLATDSEVRVMRALEQHYAKTPQNQPRRFVRLLNCFRHTGPNGTHDCIVTELLGPSVSAVVKGYDIGDFFLAPDTILRASRQILEGIEFAHQAGFVHGDISPINVAFTCNKDFISDGEDGDGDEAEIVDMLGRAPVTASYIGRYLPRPPHLPPQLVRSADWGGWYDDPEEDVCLIDWGAAFPLGEIATDIPQPLDLRSPETFFVRSFDRRHDLWRAGCVIYALFYQTFPFLYFGGNSDSVFIHTLTEKLGPLPSNWDARWREIAANDQWVDEENELQPQLITETFEPRRQAIIRQCNENEKVYARDEFTDGDYDALRCLLRVLQGLLQYEPDKRASVAEALPYIGWTDHRKEMGIDWGGSSEKGDD